MRASGPNAELASFAAIGHAPSLMVGDQIETVVRWLGLPR
jgi:hypothetical protein